MGAACGCSTNWNLLLIDSFFNGGRNSRNQTVFWYIFGYNTSSSYYTTRTYGNSLHNRNISPKPAIISYYNWQSSFKAFISVHIVYWMRCGIKAAKRSNKYIFANVNCSTVHKITAVIHKSSSAKVRVCSIIKINRSQYGQAIWKLCAQQILQSCVLFVTPWLCHVKIIAKQLRISSLSQ